MQEQVINIEIFSGIESTYDHREYLRSRGLSYSSQGRKWSLRTRDADIVSELKLYCTEHYLVYIAFNDSRIRSSHYREDFFSANEPMFGSKYICAYCFRPLSKEKVTVDHIIPIRKAKMNRFANRLLDRLEIRDINEERNLCACCKSCNSSKGSKIGLWTIRGFLGKRKPFVLMTYTLAIMFIVLLLLGMIFVTL